MTAQELKDKFNIDLRELQDMCLHIDIDEKIEDSTESRIKFCRKCWKPLEKIFSTIYYLYRHIRLDTNEVFYIGLAKRTEDDYRLNKYHRAFSRFNRSKLWKNIANKTSYETEIMLENLTLNEANEKETEFVRLYGRRDLGLGSLVNFTDGGDGVRNKLYTEEDNKSKSERVLGKKNPFFGKKHTQETKDKIRKLGQERYKDRTKHPMFGKKKSRESVERQVAKQSKPVLQYNKEGVFIKEFKGVNDTVKFGFQPTCVSACCRGKQVLHRKSIWKWKTLID